MAQDPIVTLLIVYLTTPQTDFYLPKLLESSKKPTLEPFTAANLDLGQQNVLGASMAIALTKVRIAGITNCQIAKINGKPDVVVNGNTVTFNAIRPNVEAPPSNVPTSLELTSGFVITPAGSPSLPAGGAKAVVKQATIHGTFEATTRDGTMATADIRFTSLKVKAALGANVAITVTIQSAFAAIIDSVVNTNGVQQRLLDEINSALDGAAVLAAVSKEATTAARNAFASFGQI